MRKAIIVLSIFALILSGLTYVYAQGYDFGQRHRGMHQPEAFGPRIGTSLTPEQKAKYQELLRKFNEETAQLQGSILTKRLELKSLWSNPNAEDKAIIEKEKELRDLQNEMRNKLLQLRLEVRKILSPEQIKNFWMGRGKGFGRGIGYGRGCAV